MNIPTKNECYALMCNLDMMDHIAAHSILVRRVALLIADHLIELDVPLNRELVAASSILHDITKTRSFKTGENHAETGRYFLMEKGYPEVGAIVGQHVRLDRYSNTDTPTESEIVNYADKRVLHDHVVSLGQRMEYILEQYGKIPDLREKLEWMGKKTFGLESKLFRHLPFLPGELNRFIDRKKFKVGIDDYRKVCMEQSESQPQ